MEEFEKIRLKERDIEDMRILKYEDNSNKPKIWLSDDIMYKKDIFQIMKRYYEYIKLFRNAKELDFCVFPEKLFSVDGKYMGYTTPYYYGYKSINSRMHKNKYSYKDKKELMLKIYKMIKTIHEYEFLHGDLKCSNLIWSNKDIKLIDFEKIRIRECEDPAIYNIVSKEETNYLNLVLLSVLFDIDMSFAMDMEFKEFLDDISFPMEFKEYLLNCVEYKEIEISPELPKYIKSISKKNIVEGKELVKSLQL